ncbi:cytochrome P450 [Apiospora saccharicola]
MPEQTRSPPVASGPRGPPLIGNLHQAPKSHPWPRYFTCADGPSLFCRLSRRPATSSRGGAPALPTGRACWSRWNWR